MQTRVLMLSIATAVMTWATSAVADSPHQHHCFVRGIARADYFINTISTLPYPSGVEARLQVHQVSPTYGPENPGRADLPGKKCEVPAVVLVHGSGYDSVAAFDLQFQDYSLMEALASAGIDAFAVDLLGWGLSDRFIVDDPCSASKTQQQNFLIPNPLSATCAPPLPFHFTNTFAMRDQLNAVIDDVLSRTGVPQVTLHGWSLGGAIVADYVLNGYPEKVKNVIFQAPALTCATQVPNPIQCWVAPRIRFPSQGFQSGQCMTG